MLCCVFFLRLLGIVRLSRESMTKKAIFVLTGRLLKDSGTDVCGRQSSPARRCVRCARCCELLCEFANQQNKKCHTTVHFLPVHFTYPSDTSSQG